MDSQALAQFGPLGVVLGVVVYVITQLVSKGYRVRIDIGPR
jgi:hypothetical protein